MWKIDLEWYCEDCVINHNCINCSVMDLLVDTNFKIINIIDNNENIKCWDCWELMKKSKYKNWPKYWCSCKMKNI